MMRIEFDVYGVPKTAGSKRTFPNKKTGKTIVTDDCTKGADWKADVQRVAMLNQRGPLLSGPLRVSFAFRFTRPGKHYGTGRNAAVLKPSAPKHHAQKPDVLKLSRLVEDALTSIVWNDDALITREQLSKDWAERGMRPGVHVVIEDVE